MRNLQKFSDAKISCYMVWFQQVSAQPLSTGSPSVSSFSSGECDNAILQYRNGFNRL